MIAVEAVRFLVQHYVRMIRTAVTGVDPYKV